MVECSNETLGNSSQHAFFSGCWVMEITCTREVCLYTAYYRFIDLSGLLHKVELCVCVCVLCVCVCVGVCGCGCGCVY